MCLCSFFLLDFRKQPLRDVQRESYSAPLDKILENYLSKSSIFIKIVVGRPKALLTINSFTYFAMILTTSVEQLYCRTAIYEYDNNEN